MNKMIIEVKGEIELEPSIIETSLEQRLNSHGIVLGDAYQPEGTLFGNTPTIDPPVLFFRSTNGDNAPSIRYFLMFYNDPFPKMVLSLNQLLTDKENHSEVFEINLGENKTFYLTFRNQNFKYFNLNNTEGFSIPFIQNAFKNYFQSNNDLPSNFEFYYKNDIISYMVNEKQARSPPSLRNFPSDDLNIDLINMIVDQFYKEIKHNQPT